MNDYIEVRFDLNPCDNTQCEIISALLCEVGYDSFLYDEKGLNAYIKKDLYHEKDIQGILDNLNIDSEIKYKANLIEGEDWNETWEKESFKPILIGDECVVHGSGHTDYPKAKYDIVINPKMSFGSGHHQTTTMMIQRLLALPLEGKRVLDVGTGTGILAILSGMRGASEVVGVEIEPSVYENAIENAALNQHTEIKFRCGGAEKITEKHYFDFLLANINRNIILNDFKVYADSLSQGGLMLLSGFFTEDIEMLLNKASELGLELHSQMENEGWANLCLKKM